MRRSGFVLLIVILAVALSGCDVLSISSDSELYEVTRVIDGDTIDVRTANGTQRVRYLGINTPERDEVCYNDATSANAAWVERQRVRLERDVTDTDRYDRWLRYIYVGDTLVNEEMVRNGWAEVVRYPPDEKFFNTFRRYEIAAAEAGLGCHPTGIFDDNNFDR